MSDSEWMDLYDFVGGLEDTHIKELFSKLLFEYDQYRKCGTVEDCQQRKEWMSMSIDDIRCEFNATVKLLRDEVKFIREEASKPKNKKRGRPRKEEA